MRSSLRVLARAFSSPVEAPPPPRRIWRYLSLASVSGVLGYAGYEYFQRQEGAKVEDQWLSGPLVKAYNDVFMFLTEPAVTKLLPDIHLPPGYRARRTLLLNARGTLLYLSYKTGGGWELHLRPGLHEFLARISQYYEVVLFSQDDTSFVYDLCQKLDPSRQVFAAVFGKEIMSFRRDGNFVDLKYLNRPLKDVVVLGKEPKLVKDHAGNILLLSEYTGDKNDRALREIMPFLEHLAMDPIADVRTEMDKWGHVDTAKKWASRPSVRNSPFNFARPRR